MKFFSKYIKNLIFIFLFFCSLCLYSFEILPVNDSTTNISNDIEISKDSINNNHSIFKDSPIVSMLDSLVYVKYFNDSCFTTDTSILNVYKFPVNSIPTYSDSIYNARIEVLNAETPIELTFNKNVRNFINLYAVKKRELTSKILGLAEVYFPLFEEQLDKYDMPLELKYLAVVESALNPTAKSRAGAKGLWQFMYRTGKMYGLKSTSYVDDRFDPYKSTIAACRHLKDLYEIYDNWSLALAAYNSGAGNVNKAIRRAGGVKNYWAIWPFLPRETRGYVPAFISVIYLMNYPAEHNLYPVDPGIISNNIDTITVKDILSFDQISEMLNIPLEDIKFLNPSYKLGVIPSTKDKTYILRLPKKYIGAFINNETALYNYKTKKGIEKDKLLAQIKKAKKRNIHIVRYGENLGLIAQKYRCSVRNLKNWNNLRGTTIYPGQKLIVYASAKKNSATTKKSQPKKDINFNNSSKYVYHTIRKGDTLWDIAREYNGVTVEQIKKLNNIRNTKKLKPGQKIKIAVQS
ncbi:MAG: LysM peptidoglycan-binding domain-containing protein [Bacteroidales bacterium]|nr:LysM peptidoglycan-binding domain-containing protein [Bacteroidales bacterium]